MAVIFGPPLNPTYTMDVVLAPPSPVFLRRFWLARGTVRRAADEIHAWVSVPDFGSEVTAQRDAETLLRAEFAAGRYVTAEEATSGGLEQVVPPVGGGYWRPVPPACVPTVDLAAGRVVIAPAAEWRSRPPQPPLVVE